MVTSKEQKINDLEKDIETFVKRFADENEELKKENERLKIEYQSHGRQEDEIKEFKMVTADKIDQISEALEHHMRQNQQLQEHLDKQAQIESRLVEKVE